MRRSPDASRPRPPLACRHDPDHGVTRAEALQMAHVGTPSDLAKQPAASTGRIDPWKPLFAAMVIIAMVAVVATASAFLAGSDPRRVDRSHPRTDRRPPAARRGGRSRSRQSRRPPAARRAGHGRLVSAAHRSPACSGRSRRPVSAGHGSQACSSRSRRPVFRSRSRRPIPAPRRARLSSRVSAGWCTRPRPEPGTLDRLGDCRH